MTAHPDSLQNKPPEFARDFPKLMLVMVGVDIAHFWG
jgi:hypothetical protein